MSELPLAGVRVLDLTRALAGPFCTTLLGDLGADVIKVESTTGDVIRQWGPFHEGASLYHLSVNRNKRSLAVDFRSHDGRELLQLLAPQCDVVVENFRRGIIEQIGLGPDWISTSAPKTILASLSGYGSTGPLAELPAFDQIIQGMSGLMSVTGQPESGPVRFGIPIVDMLTGMFGALGVVAAIAGNNQKIKHKKVDTSLLESALGVLTFQAQRYLSTGETPSSTGNDHPVISPYGVFSTADKPINIAVATSDQFERLCALLGDPGLSSDGRFQTGELRAINRFALQQLIEKELKRSPASAWLAHFHANGIPAGPVNDVGAVFADAQVQAVDMVQEIELPNGSTARVLRGPLRMDDQPLPVRRVPPDLGANTREILEEFGVPAEDIERLLERGVVAQMSNTSANRL